MNFNILGIFSVLFALFLFSHFFQLYLWFGSDATYLRLPRLLKIFSYWEFIERLDAILEKPYILRIVKTVNYMLYLIHINACAYYAISSLEGIGKVFSIFSKTFKPASQIVSLRGQYCMTKSQCKHK
jgi:hypothetical protein